MSTVEAPRQRRRRTIEAALLDDLNTPQALAVIAELATASRRATTPESSKAAKAALLGAGEMLGLLRLDPETWFKQARRARAGRGQRVDPAEIDASVAQRNAARKSRDFAEADRIRDELAAKSIAIEDGAQGTRWKVVNPNERAA